MTVWFITGASRGFGRQLADTAIRAGDEVVVAARDPQSALASLPDLPDRVASVRLDVTDQDEAHAAVEAARQRFGRIDVLVNNAGYGLFGSVEESSDDDVRALFDTNVFGLLNVTRAMLPLMRAQGFGHIINMSSSAGFASSAGRGLYSASKFAVEGVSEGLHDELEPLGIHVTVVEPGSFRTDFLSTQSRRSQASQIPAYASTVGSLLSTIEQSSWQQPGDPAAAAVAIRRITRLSDPPMRLQLGSDAVEMVEQKAGRVLRDLQTWRSLSLSTDFAP